MKTSDCVTHAGKATRGPGSEGAGLQVTMPSTGMEDFSKDSLDDTKSHSSTTSSKRYSNGCIVLLG